MGNRNPFVQQSERDQLISRPRQPLPTAADPRGPRARGYPSDPKPTPPAGQGTNPRAGDIGYTA